MKRRSATPVLPDLSSAPPLAELFAAWQRLFPEVDWSFVELRVVPRRAGRDLNSATGFAERLRGRGRYRITVRVGWSASDARATLLHEMAHIATWRERAHHGPKWRMRLALAVREIAGEVCLPKGSWRKAHEAVRERMIGCPRKA